MTESQSAQERAGESPRLEGIDSDLTGRDLAKFTVLVAFSAIFIDAAIGHGLLWENDPYWTYWVTKTFLIATIFGIGTALLGVGAGRGALITGVHTLILTVYYWTLSPIGLPSHPEWLDLEHTWVTGIPVHFGVIYLGYLLALWVWRRRRFVQEESPRRLGLNALVVGLLIVLLAGAASSLLAGGFPGVTWFVVRMLITVTFLIGWWAVAGRDAVAATIGASLLALVWATYGHFLSPVGLPDIPLRILNPEAPGATVLWQSYRELWLVSLPVHIILIAGILLVEAARHEAGRRVVGPLVSVALPAAILLSVGLFIPDAGEVSKATLRADGDVSIEIGEWYSDEFAEGTGRVEIEAVDHQARVTPLRPHDQLRIDATIEGGGLIYEVSVNKAMVDDPLGRHGTWWGVGLDKEHHGRSGIGTRKLPTIKSDLAAFGIGTLELNGVVVARELPVHIMTAEKNLAGNASFELSVGDPDAEDLKIPDGHLRVLWRDYDAEIEDRKTNRYMIGSGVLLLSLIGMGLAFRRE